MAVVTPRRPLVWEVERLRPPTHGRDDICEACRTRPERADQSVRAAVSGGHQRRCRDDQRDRGRRRDVRTQLPSPLGRGNPDRRRPPRRVVDRAARRGRPDPRAGRGYLPARGSRATQPLRRSHGHDLEGQAGQVACSLHEERESPVCTALPPGEQQQHHVRQRPRRRRARRTTTRRIPTARATTAGRSHVRVLER